MLRQVKKVYFLGAALAIFLLCSLIFASCTSRTRVNILSALAYDKNPQYGYTVYIEEAGELKPYLVLTNDYSRSGNTLLLRKEILPELRFYNNWYLDKPSYYNESEIDVWLNGEFLDNLGGLQTVPSEINITSIEAIGRTGDEAEDIVRKVFLLSWGEVGGEYNYVMQTNGYPLAYFRTKRSRIAMQESYGHAENWFLRSTDTWNFTAPAVVVFDGGLGSGDVGTKLGVRPAFCLDSDTEVVYLENEDLGRIFILKS